jgi:hypothetical protein
VADAPWRCSQCGTVNEPSANSCRACGRWPSLFDLERSTLEEAPGRAEDAYRRDAPAPEEMAPPAETFEPAEPFEPEQGYPDVPRQEWPGPGDPLDDHPVSWPARLASWIVPIALVVYIVISLFANR